MERHNQISATVFCKHHRIQVSFLQKLHEQGLIILTNEAAECFLQPDELETAERFVRLHYDLQINVEDFDVIGHLLQRMEAMQSEIASLRNKLLFYRQYQSGE